VLGVILYDEQVTVCMIFFAQAHTIPCRQHSSHGLMQNFQGGREYDRCKK